jgi:hypothetical protein
LVVTAPIAATPAAPATKPSPPVAASVTPPADPLDFESVMAELEDVRQQILKTPAKKKPDASSRREGEESTSDEKPKDPPF